MTFGIPTNDMKATIDYHIAIDTTDIDAAFEFCQIL